MLSTVQHVDVTCPTRIAQRDQKLNTTCSTSAAQHDEQSSTIEDKPQIVFNNGRNHCQYKRKMRKAVKAGKASTAARKETKR